MLNQNVKFARAETCLIMEPMHSNIHGNVHGGELMKMMDNTAGIAAAKQAKGLVVTARVDEIEFHQSVNVGNIVTVVAQVCYVGRSSIQVQVNVYVHDIENYTEPIRALSAFFTMVHIKEGKPTLVNPLVITNDEERVLYELGEKKYNEIQAKKVKK